MKKFNKYGASHKNPQTAPWEGRMYVKTEIRDYLTRLFQQDKDKGLTPIYYWHHHACDFMAIDTLTQFQSQERMFRDNGVELVKTKVLTNQSWCGFDKVYMNIYRSIKGDTISHATDPLAFAFDYMLGSTELIYFSPYPIGTQEKTMEVFDDMFV